MALVINYDVREDELADFILEYFLECYSLELEDGSDYLVYKYLIDIHKNIKTI